jgi:hypothetical protein
VVLSSEWAVDTYLDLFLAKGHAPHNLQTRRLVRLRIGPIRLLENDLVLGPTPYMSAISGN